MQALQMRCAGQAWQTAHWLGTLDSSICQCESNVDDSPGAVCLNMLMSNVGAACRAQLHTAAFLLPMYVLFRAPSHH